MVKMIIFWTGINDHTGHNDFFTYNVIGIIDQNYVPGIM